MHTAPWGSEVALVPGLLETPAPQIRGAQGVNRVWLLLLSALVWNLGCQVTQGTVLQGKQG